MPGTVNGIGTHYYGRSNQHSRLGICEHCQRVTELQSYDVTNFFVIAFIPFVPLGKKRVLDYCTSCTYHYSVPLKGWNAEREATLKATSVAFKQQPTTETAIEALAAVAGFQDKKAFPGLAQALRNNMSDNSDVMTQLGRVCESFFEPEQAKAAYLKAININDNIEAKVCLARLLCLEGQPGQAAPFVEHLLTTPDKEDVGALMLVVDAYQAQGQHEQALAYLGEIVRAYPELENDPEILKSQKISTKNLGKNKMIKMPHLQVPKQPAQGKDDSKAPLLPMLIGPAIILLVLSGFFILDGLAGRSHDLWLLNGTPQDYTVTIADKEHRVKAHSKSMISIPEGTHEAVVVGSPMPIKPIEFTIENARFTRLFDNTTYVLNPDRAAVMLWEEAEYSENPDLNADVPYKIHVGEAFYEFDGLHYVFEEFPDTIEITSGSTITKRGVVYWNDLDEYQKTQLIVEEFPEARYAHYYKLLALSDPTNWHYISSVGSVLDDQEYLAFFSQHLDVVPPSVERHMTYQDIIKYQKPEVDLLSEYIERANAHPEWGDYAFLVARLLSEDHAQVTTWLERAMAATNQSGYACAMMMDRMLVAGKYSEAEKLYKLAKSKGFHNSEVDDVWWNCLLALGKYEEVLALAEANAEDDPYNSYYVADQIIYLTRLKRPEDATARAAEHLELLNNDEDFTEDEVLHWTNYFAACKAYEKGDHKGYANSMLQLDTDAGSIAAALAQYNITVAMREIEASEAPVLSNMLLVYAAAKQANKQDIATRAMTLIEATSGDEYREFKHCLSLLKQEKVDPDQVILSSLYIDDKVPLLLAFAEHFPDQRERYLEAARNLNVSILYPRNVVDRLLK